MYFTEYLLSGEFKTRGSNFSLNDFAKKFPKSLIHSDVSIKNTSKRDLSDVLLREYFPQDKIEDVLLGKGIDRNQKDTKFYSWDEFLQK